MTPEIIFYLVTIGVIPLWLMLIIFPTWEWTHKIVSAMWAPLVFGLIYLFCQASDTEPPAGAGFLSLHGIMLLFTSKYGMLAAWIHFIVVDLFVGSWMVRDSIRIGLRHRWVAPSLLLTFAMAPLGLAFYLIVRAILKKKVTLQEATS